MASTVWKGYITFGLVSIPVRIFRAARAERVKLRQLYRPPQTADAPKPEEPGPSPEPDTPEPEPAVPPVAAAVQRVYQAASGANNEPIHQSDLVKGFEYSKDQFVVLDQQDLRSLAPETSTEMPILSFVPFREIDPIYLETSYYVAPDGIGEKPYALLFEAMRGTDYAAIGQLTMHRRDHVMILRAGKTGLIAHTMFYADEVRTSQEFRTDTTLVAEKELTLAKTLIDALAGTFDPSGFKNKFRESLQGLIDSKIAGREVTAVRHPETKTAPVIDIMDALRRSLERSGVKAAAATRKPASAAGSSKEKVRTATRRK